MHSSDDMMNKNLKTVIQKRSLSDEVASRLQEQISQGIYKVDDKLPIEPELMKSFGVGRSTIREAIKSLVNAGLLRVQQGVGTFVEPISSSAAPIDQRMKRASMKDLHEVRQLLEMKIAEKAALYRTEEDLKQIKIHLDARAAAIKASDISAVVDADIAFHTAIAVASRNEVLSDLYRSVSVHLKKGFLRIHSDTREFEESHPLHEQLLKSIIAQDPKKAWNTVEKIISDDILQNGWR